MNLAKGAQLAGLTALSVLTVVLVVLAMTRSVATTAEASAPLTPVAEEDTATVVSVLGDGHVLAEGSWFYRAIPAEDGGPVERGVVLAEEDARARSLESRLDQVVAGDIVMIAAGAVDVSLGEPAPEIVADIKVLVRGVRERDATPVLVLVPPSNERGFLTKLVNRKLSAYGERRDIAVLDIFSPVATTPGRWLKRYTDDGEYANPEGAARQAQVVIDRLDWLMLAQQQAA
ncbi:SGNH/GDSL hydrolase family protein [Nocardioidaceae bacterium]|nr:SGNH/GDSL hydrolase family protein [Nocardioidaceae bacterium]